MGELRRLLIVASPGAAALAVAAILIATVLEGEGETGQRGPRIGIDHWHATYEIFICGEQQPHVPQWQSGIHTHDDGVIHIHPFVSFEEGDGARLVNWFEYGGGRVTADEIRMPGSRETYRNGDRCRGGGRGVLQVFVNGEPLGDWSRYIPQDGDRIRIVFGPKEIQAPSR